MARILYEALRTAPFLGVLWPTCGEDHWRNVQTDYCQQYIQEPDSIALVSSDEEGALSASLEWCMDGF